MDKFKRRVRSVGFGGRLDLGCEGGERLGWLPGFWLEVKLIVVPWTEMGATKNGQICGGNVMSSGFEHGWLELPIVAPSSDVYSRQLNLWVRKQKEGQARAMDQVPVVLKCALT